MSEETYVLEISRYLHPELSLEELRGENYYRVYQEPYLSFKFYRGFENPSPVERAKIYRAIFLACKDGKCNRDNLVNLITVHGIIIKIKTEDENGFHLKFTQYYNENDNTVLIPDPPQSSEYTFTYTRRLLRSFLDSQGISYNTLRNNEHGSIFLFALIDDPLPDDLSDSHGNMRLYKQWKEYNQDGVRYKVKFTGEKIGSFFQIFGWEERVSFDLLEDGSIESTVKGYSKSEVDEKKSRLDESVASGWGEYLELDELITDEYMAFGIIRVLDRSDVIPLLNTKRIYFTGEPIDLDKIKNYRPEEVLDEREIFTQRDFSTMNRYQYASLIKGKSGTPYSYLDLYQTNLERDPLTREEFSQEFKAELSAILDRLRGPFLSGFPPKMVTPELIQTSDAGLISFHMVIEGEHIPFWIIPDLTDLGYHDLISDLSATLVMKWLDRTLFENGFIGLKKGVDPFLMFSPIALFVFEMGNTRLTYSNFYTLVFSLQVQLQMLRQCN